MIVEIKKAVQDRYGRLITSNAGCCRPCCTSKSDSSIPSFGVGKPVDDANLQLGETVLDIGSGAGGNCISAAKLVGDQGQAIGLDLTDEMLEAARRYASDLGVTNVSFVKGDAENMPFPDSLFDVVISDCVINLVPDKQKAFAEAFRVLKQGGRMIISDVVSDRLFPVELEEDTSLWCECISGALLEKNYTDLMRQAGFTGVEPLTKEYSRDIAGIKVFHATYRAVK